MELARRLELRCAVGAPRQMLFEFITRVIGQLVVDVEQNVFFNPLAFHNHTPQGKTSSHISQRAPQLLGRAKQSVLRGFFRRIQHLTHSPQFKPVVVLQFKNHALPRR